MEKLGSEVATLFTHSHIVSLVVSSQHSPVFALHLTLLGAGSHPSICNCFSKLQHLLHVLDTIQVQLSLLFLYLSHRMQQPVS